MALFENEDIQVTALQEHNTKLQAMVEQLQTRISNTSVRHMEEVNGLQSKINKIIDNLTMDYWYDRDCSKTQILEELCEILDHEPKQTITFSANIVVDGSVDVPLSDLDDFDLRYFLQDELSVDVYNSDIEIQAFDVVNVNQSDF